MFNGTLAEAKEIASFFNISVDICKSKGGHFYWIACPNNRHDCTVMTYTFDEILDAIEEARAWRDGI